MYSFDFHYKITNIKNEKTKRKEKRIINHIASYD